MTERPISFVCCSHPSPEWRWIGGAVEARLRPYLSGPTVLRDKESVFLQMQGEPVLVMTVPAPFPASELLETPAQRAAWPECREAAAAWRSHFIVSATDNTALLADRRTAVENTMLVAATLVGVAHGDAVGWGPTGLFHDGSAFVARVAADPLHAENLVSYEWNMEDGANGLSQAARTRGLCVFGLPEIVHIPSSEDRRVIQTRLMTLASYVIARGLAFRPGETVGADAQTKATIETSRAPTGEPLLIVTPAHLGVPAAA